MSWETELQDASFRGVPFECISTDDVHSKTLAIHQSPYSDDAEIEDMGNDPRKVSIQAVFAGETYLSDYHKLEAALNERGEPYRVCRRPLFLRECPDEKSKIHP